MLGVACCRAVLSVAVVLCGLAGIAAADFQQGLAAYNRGDFQTALEQWQPLADAGDPTAQTALGEMYYNGRGVVADRATAASWFLKAADQGHISAQYALGRLYELGDGVNRDLVQAYMWLHLAATHAKGDTSDYLATNRNQLAAHMTAEQISAAQEMAKQWNNRHPQ